MEEKQWQEIGKNEDVNEQNRMRKNKKQKNTYQLVLEIERVVTSSHTHRVPDENKKISMDGERHLDF